MSAECLVRIKIGARIGHDHLYGKWPKCRGIKKSYETSEPDAIFLARKNKNFWMCKRYGFGITTDRNSYGNGPVFVFDLDGVELLTPMHLPGVLKLE